MRVFTIFTAYEMEYFDKMLRIKIYAVATNEWCTALLRQED